MERESRVNRIERDDGGAAPGWMPLPQVVARKLQTMILNGTLKPGDRIPSQRVLSDSFSVSRASLREALLTLETLGLIRTEPGRGTFVTAGRQSPDAADLKWRYADSYPMPDVFQTRLMLESQISAAAAAVIGAMPLAALAEATDRMERCWEEGDLLSNVEADLAFHLAIAQSCGNRLLLTLYDTVRSLLTETQRQPIPRTRSDRMRESLAEHRAVIAALAAGDAEAARQAMAAHVRNTALCAGIVI
ncbi:FCD domain-containing protein [Paracoccaceae bacterium Fryx2]|nr:FCD domain-containing protein [Paracoccaceae bacterium Fryx2]